jgi:hypothetical protein
MANYKKKKVKELFMGPDPQLEIVKVTTDGKVTLKFNQDMLVPEKVDLALLSKAMRFSLKPDQDSEAKIYGPFV